MTCSILTSAGFAGCIEEIGWTGFKGQLENHACAKTQNIDVCQLESMGNVYVSGIKQFLSRVRRRFWSWNRPADCRAG